MNKDTFEIALMNRLLVEQNYALLVDADEHSSQLPKQQAWAQKLENNDSESFEQDVLDYLDACAVHQATLPVIGGVFDNCVYGETDEVIWQPEKVVLPSLQPLKNYASRVLVSINPMSTKVLLLTDANYPRVNKETLIELCKKARNEILNFFGMEKNSLHTVMIKTVMVCEPNVATRRFTKKNTKRVSLDKIFFQYLCVDLQHENVWTPTPIRSWVEKRTIKTVISSEDNSIESLYASYHKVTFSWLRVILSGLVAFILTLVASLTSLHLDSGLLYTLSQALVPMIVFAVCFTTMKNRSKAYKQVIYGASIHVLLMVALYYFVRSPVDFNDWLSLFQLVFITGAPSLLVGRVIELTSTY